MATSGTIYGTASKSWQLKIDYSYTQDTASNTSSVTAQLYVYNNNSAHNYDTAYYTLQGTTTTYRMDYGSTKAWNALGSKVITVNHNTDGTGSVTLSGYWYSGISGSSYTPLELSVSGTVTLNTIPRASKISSLSTDSPTIGGSVTINIDKKASSYYHKLFYTIDGVDTQIGSAFSGTSYTWTPTASTFYSKIPNNTNLPMFIKLYTYTNSSCSTQVGSWDTKNIRWYCNETDCKPTLTIALQDTNSTTANLTGAATTTMIKGYSNIKATVTATAKNSATIKTRKITYNGVTADYSAAVTYNAATNNTWSASTTDSRGYTNTVTKTLTIINYYKPTINLSVLMALDSSDLSKATATLSVSGTDWQGNFGATTNSVSYDYRYKTSGGTYSSWASGGTVSAANYSTSKVISNLTAANNYVFQVRIKDKLTASVESVEVAASAKPVFDFDKDDFAFNVPISLTSITLTNHVTPNSTDTTEAAAKATVTTQLNNLLTSMNSGAMMPIKFTPKEKLVGNGNTYYCWLCKHDSSYAVIFGFSYNGYRIFWAKGGGTWGTIKNTAL